MALRMARELATGDQYAAMHHEIDALTIDYKTFAVTLTLGFYKDRAALLAGKEAVMTRSFPVPVRAAYQIVVAMDERLAIYNWLKARPEFATAVLANEVDPDPPPPIEP